MLIIIRRMSEPIVEWVGSSCGKHGTYTFYKGFKLTANGESRKYLLGEFYFIRNSKDRPICIAEFQLLWHDAITDNQLASARLYFRPENIPGGRQTSHGKDELLYTDEKVVINCKDMMTIEYDGTGWSYGIKAISELNLQEVPTRGGINSTSEDTKKFRLLKRTSKTKKLMPKERSKMIILSFSAYCRFKSLVKKLLSGQVLTKMAIKAFGGIVQCTDNTWVSFSRETFHHPGLVKFDMFSHNKAPVLKGRPRKKKVSKISNEKGKIKQSLVVVGVDRRPSQEADTSDDNQTDTSETSSFCGQDFPGPPKLVTAVKEEPAIPVSVPRGVIRSAKQASSEYDAKAIAIPPMPKLVKIEPQKASSVSYGNQLRHQTKSGETLLHTGQTSYHGENNISSKMSVSSSVISSSHYLDETAVSTGPCVSLAPRHDDNSSRIVLDKFNYPASTHSSMHTNVPASLHANRSLLPRAMTATTTHNIQPRISTIVPTPLLQHDVTENSITTEVSRPGNEPRPEQPLKRKRGRPPGKSSKIVKLSEVKIAPKKVEANVIQNPDVQIKIEKVVSMSGEHMYAEQGFVMEDEEFSPEPQDVDEREFMKNLKMYMRKRGTPIEKIPALGFRKINLFKMYEVTQSLGGYDEVTSKRLWRRVYSEVGGAPSITSAATNSRRHYEKLLLPYERHVRGEEYKLYDRTSETSSPETESVVSPRRDQNGNVVSQYEGVVSLTNQHVKLSKAVVAPLNLEPIKVPAVSHAIQLNQTDNRLKPTGVLSPQNELYKSSGPYGVSLSQKNNILNSSVARVISMPEGQVKHAISHITSEYTRPKPTTVLSVNQQDRTYPVVSHTIEQIQQSTPKVSSQSQRERRPVVPPSQHQQNKPITSDQKSSVEFVTSASRGSPVMLYSSNVDRYSTFDQRNIRHGIPSALITSTGTSDRLVASTQSSLCNEKAYITEFSDDHPGMYIPAQNSIKNESRTSMLALERKQRLPHFDHVNDFSRSRDHYSSEHIPKESRGKRPRGSDDEILVTNVVPSKISRAHSPVPCDEGYMFSVPVFQPSHYPHAGFELYDLPTTTFPVRASSRIFMPPHQVYAGPGHPAFSPCTPHIIATIGTDPASLYQLPIPGYYSHEVAYPMDSGVTILHS